MIFTYTISTLRLSKDGVDGDGKQGISYVITHVKDILSMNS